MAVNSPRPCIICGSQFYPSMSNSLFHCDDDNCIKEYIGVMEELGDDDYKLLDEYDEEEGE